MRRLGDHGRVHLFAGGRLVSYFPRRASAVELSALELLSDPDVKP